MPTLDISRITQKISARYPAVLANPKHKSDLIGLIKKGNEDQVVIYAKDVLDRKPNLKAHNKIAVDQRIQRRDWMKFQVEIEKELGDIYNLLADKVIKLLMNASDDSGIIPFAKSRHLLGRIRDFVYKSYSEITVLIKSAVRKSIKDGIFQTGDASQVGADFVQDQKESNDREVSLRFSDIDVNREEQISDLIEAPIKPGILKTSGVFQKIFNRVKKMRIEKGLFPFKHKPRQIGAYATGQPLSRLIWDIRQSHLSKMRTIVANGIAQGRSAISVAKDIEKFTRTSLAAQAKTIAPSGPGIYASPYKNALRVTRTEMNSSYVSAQLEYVKQKGYKVQWHANPEACPICLPMDGKVLDPENVDIPRHPSCILPGQLIYAPDAIAGAKNSYNGPCIEILLSSGNRISVTENHPILTQQGWIKSKFLREGDNVIIATDPERISFSINPDNYDGPSLIEDIFKSFVMSEQMASVRVKHSSEDFHGDARFMDGDINIIGPNRLLWSRNKTIRTKAGIQFDLDKRGKFNRSFFSDSPKTEFFKSGFSSPASNVRIFCNSTTLVQGHRGKSFLHQDRGNLMRSDSSFCRHGLSLLEGNEKKPTLHSLSHSSQFNIILDKNTLDGPKTDIETIRYFLNRFSSFISSANIVSIRKFNFRGHVYDLQCSDYKLYTCNRVIVSNCSCFISTFIPGLSEE